MKTQRIAWAVGAVVLIGAGWAVQAQMQHPRERSQPQGSQDQERGRDMAADHGGMKERCHEMMQRMRNMQSQMEQMDRELEQQIEEMDEAEGQAKIEAMAEAIRTLSEQRRQHLERRTAMMQDMMQHMGQHMTMGRAGDGEGESMMKCPMMQGGMEAQPKQARSHEEDH